MNWLGEKTKRITLQASLRILSWVILVVIRHWRRWSPHSAQHLLYLHLISSFLLVLGCLLWLVTRWRSSWLGGCRCWHGFVCRLGLGFTRRWRRWGRWGRSTWCWCFRRWRPGRVGFGLALGPCSFFCLKIINCPPCTCSIPNGFEYRFRDILVHVWSQAFLPSKVSLACLFLSTLYSMGNSSNEGLGEDHVALSGRDQKFHWSLSLSLFARYTVKAGISMPSSNPWSPDLK